MSSRYRTEVHIVRDDGMHFIMMMEVDSIVVDPSHYGSAQKIQIHGAINDKTMMELSEYMGHPIHRPHKESPIYISSGYAGGHPYPDKWPKVVAIDEYDDDTVDFSTKSVSFEEAMRILIDVDKQYDTEVLVSDTQDLGAIVEAARAFEGVSNPKASIWGQLPPLPSYPPIEPGVASPNIYVDYGSDDTHISTHVKEPIEPMNAEKIEEVKKITEEHFKRVNRETKYVVGPVFTNST